MNMYDNLSEALLDLNKRGYTIDFNKKKDCIYCKSLNKDFSSHDFEVTEYYQFNSNLVSGSQSIIYALETNDGYKGVLLDGYGGYSVIHYDLKWTRD